MSNLIEPNPEGYFTLYFVDGSVHIIDADSTEEGKPGWLMFFMHETGDVVTETIHWRGIWPFRQKVVVANHNEGQVRRWVATVAWSQIRAIVAPRQDGEADS